MKMLYHATMVELPVGDKLKPVVTDIEAVTDGVRLEAERLLEQRRPEGMPSRLSSWFTCDEPGLAAEYLEAEIKCGLSKSATNDQRHLYAVQTDLSSRHPMVLVNKIAVKLSEGQIDYALFLTNEYWAPKQEWRFWEYLSSEIRVVAEEAWPNWLSLSEAIVTYSRDFETLNHLLNNLGL